MHSKCSLKTSPVARKAEKANLVENDRNLISRISAVTVAITELYL